MNTESNNEYFKRVKKGEIHIDVDPALARKFFFDSDIETINEEIGEKLSIESLLVNLCGLVAPILLIVEIILSIIALKWYSIIAIPIMVKVFYDIIGKTAIGRQGFIGSLIFIIICVILACYFKDMETIMTVWLILLPLPFFVLNLMYTLASLFIHSLVLRNEKAFNLLKNKIFTLYNY